MKIAIASTDKTEATKVSKMAGRARYILFFENNKLVKTLKNPFAAGGGGAGFAAAKIIADEKAEIFIAGQLGQNMKDTLDKKNIRYLELPDISIKEALEKAKNA